MQTHAHVHVYLLQEPDGSSDPSAPRATPPTSAALLPPEGVQVSLHLNATRITRSVDSLPSNCPYPMQNFTLSKISYSEKFGQDFNLTVWQIVKKLAN